VQREGTRRLENRKGLFPGTSGPVPPHGFGGWRLTSPPLYHGHLHAADRNSLPQDANALGKIVLDVAGRLDRALALCIATSQTPRTEAGTRAVAPGESRAVRKLTVAMPTLGK
jgi:hypothetical protein